MSIDTSTEAFESGVQNNGLITPAPNLDPVYQIGIAVDDCLPAAEDIDGVVYDEQAFAYGLILEFDTYNDMIAFERHPERGSIQNGMIQYMVEHGKESLELELSRDQNPVYTETGEAGPDSFTSGTLGDLQVTVDDLITQTNAAYSTNIRNGFVAEDSVQISGCIPNDLGPNEFAVIDPATTGTFFDPSKGALQ